jgi:glycosyltransferase involved in cell wall biosynthesis
MKVLFINTTDISGGAAIAAYRLAKGLKSYCSTNNYFLVAEKKSQDKNVFQTTANQLQRFTERIVGKITNIFGMQYQWFPFSTNTILKATLDLKPDIISLHNTHGNYFKTSLIKELSKLAPIVWTLHDMWSFTGNPAHTFGDESWKFMESPKNYKHIPPSIGINTGKLLLRQKKDIYRDSDITIVTPSRWLYNLVIQSPVFNGKKLLHIPHGIDLSIFKPSDKKTCRINLNIPEDANVLMFIAECLQNNPYKGGKEFFEILHSINSKVNHKIHLIFLGKGEFKKNKGLKNLIIHKMGYVQKEDLISLCLSTADVFINPAKADNLPNVLIESISCGTPCVTFNVGGCGEIIKNGISGILIEPFNIERFADSVLNILEEKRTLASLSESARVHAEENYSLRKMALNYFELFANLIQKKKV